MRKVRSPPSLACSDEPVQDPALDYPSLEAVPGPSVADAERASSFGARTWSDGAEYHGEWLEGAASGRGRLRHPNGDVYVGEWSRSVAHGHGVFLRADGTKYVGQFCNDKQDGFGVETFPNGASYAGTFLFGKKSGLGVYSWPDGSRFEGQWSADVISGVGSYVGAGGRRYRGRWLGSRMHGIGRFVWPEGLVFEGQFADDAEQGFGVYQEPDGGMAHWGFWPLEEGQDPATAARRVVRPPEEEAPAAPTHISRGVHFSDRGVRPPDMQLGPLGLLPLPGAEEWHEEPLEEPDEQVYEQPDQQPDEQREGVRLLGRQARYLNGSWEARVFGGLPVPAGGAAPSEIVRSISEKQPSIKAPPTPEELLSIGGLRDATGGGASEEASSRLMASPTFASVMVDEAIRERRWEEKVMRYETLRVDDVEVQQHSAAPSPQRRGEAAPAPKAAPTPALVPEAEPAPEARSAPPDAAPAAAPAPPQQRRKSDTPPERPPGAGLTTISEGADPVAARATPSTSRRPNVFGRTCTSHSVKCTVAGAVGSLPSPSSPRAKLRGRTALQKSYKLEGCSLVRAGTRSVVFRLAHRDSGRVDAVKTMPADSSAEAQLRLLRRLRHPNIGNLLDSYRSEASAGKSGYVHLALECCSGGSLYDYLFDSSAKEPKGAPIDVVPLLSWQAAAAIAYCHRSGVCHRDVKLENFMLASATAKPALKLIDFGLACRCKASGKMATRVGTPHYVAPEVLLGSYTPKCDVWGLGVVIFLLCVGRPPFPGAGDEEILRKVRDGAPEYRQQDWLQDDLKKAKLMLGSALDRDANARLSASALLRHPWLARAAPRSCCRCLPWSS